jgi:hypothetical protein
MTSPALLVAFRGGWVPVVPTTNSPFFNMPSRVVAAGTLAANEKTSKVAKIKTKTDFFMEYLL